MFDNGSHGNRSQTDDSSFSRDTCSNKGAIESNADPPPPPPTPPTESIEAGHVIPPGNRGKVRGREQRRAYV